MDLWVFSVCLMLRCSRTVLSLDQGLMILFANIAVRKMFAQINTWSLVANMNYRSDIKHVRHVTRKV